MSRLFLGGRRGQPGGDIPVMCWEAPASGPVVAVCANVHGDEGTGIHTVQRLDALARVHLTRGALVLYPSCNPGGLQARTRKVPNDDQDLNRMFPGNLRGSWSSRLAATIWKDLSARRPAVVVDLHADAPVAIPYVILDRPVRHATMVRRTLGGEIERLAEATGLTALREYTDDLYLQFGLDGSLAGAAVNVLGVPALTIEAGPRRWTDPASVDAMVQAVSGVLTAAGIWHGEVARHPTRTDGLWRRAASPRARRGGMLAPAVSPGARVDRGERLASLIALTGEVEEDVLAPEPCVVVSWVEGLWIGPGDVIGTLGVVDGERL